MGKSKSRLQLDWHAGRLKVSIKERGARWALPQRGGNKMHGGKGQGGEGELGRWGGDLGKNLRGARLRQASCLIIGDPMECQIQARSMLRSSGAPTRGCAMLCCAQPMAPSLGNDGCEQRAPAAQCLVAEPGRSCSCQEARGSCQLRGSTPVVAWMRRSSLWYTLFSAAAQRSAGGQVSRTGGTAASASSSVLSAAPAAACAEAPAAS